MVPYLAKAERGSGYYLKWTSRATYLKWAAAVVSNNCDWHKPRSQHSTVLQCSLGTWTVLELTGNVTGTAKPWL